MDICLATKAHLVLRRMDIDVDFIERQVEKQHHRGILALHQQSLVAEQHRVSKHFIAHVTPVDEGKKIARVRIRGRRCAQETVRRNIALSALKENQSLGHVAPEHLGQPVSRIADGNIIGDRARVMMQAEVHVRMRQSHAMNDVANMTQLGRRSFQKFTPGR